MAQPLTSSQLFRAKQGFGVAPDTVSRKQAAAAGISPLTTEEKFRQERGWGVEEGDAESMAAFGAASVMERGGPMGEMPEEYGGRTVGSTRRDMRRQMEYDQAQQQYLRNQLMMQQAEESSARLDEIEIQIGARELEKARNARIADEGKFIFETIAGNKKVGVDEDGNDVFSEPLNPSAPGAIDKIANLMKMYHGMENPIVSTTVMRLYNDAIKAEENRMEDSKRSIEEQDSFLIDKEAEASELGIDTSPFYKTEIDPETQKVVITSVDRMGINRAIGLAKRNDLEKKKKEVGQSKLDEETKEQAMSVLDEINKIDAEIRKANFNAGRERNATKRDEFIANEEFYRGEREVLTERFNGLVPRRPVEDRQPQSFDTPEEAEAAKLPKGTIVVIGGRRARID